MNDEHDVEKFENSARDRSFKLILDVPARHYANERSAGTWNKY